MAQKDKIERTLESYNDVFADIVNALLFDGKTVITEDSLTDAQPFSLYKMDGDARIQERDVAKYWRNRQIRLGLCGIENQSAVDSDMPLRVIGYDGAAYRAQLSEKGQKERYPVVTLVLYFGTERRWNSPVSLKERLSVGKEFEPFVSDYKINVFELAWLSDEKIANFRSDFREVLEYLRACRLKTTYAGSKKNLAHVWEILDLFKALSGKDFFENAHETIENVAAKNQGGVNMYDAFQAAMDKELALGEQRAIALGRNEGIALGERRILSLFSKLYEAGRGSDVQKATNDREFLKQLLDEFQK